MLRCAVISRAIAKSLPRRAQSCASVAHCSTSTRLTSSTQDSAESVDAPGLQHFISKASSTQLQHTNGDSIASLTFLGDQKLQANRKFFIETYGCQMNVSDSEIVESILLKAGLQRTMELEDANVVLVNTCSIREKAEERVWNRLREFRAMRRKAPKGSRDLIVGVLGCMAERLKEKLLEEHQLVDVVVGPDAYRDLPRLISKAETGESAINTLLSLDETYADIAPVRHSFNGVSAFISIMRGCNNMCSYCIVPWTRGRERSRNADSIVEEVKRLSGEGYKEITLLGQNVNSYNDVSGVVQGGDGGGDGAAELELSNKGFSQKCKVKHVGVRFAELLDRVCRVDSEMRIRFTSPHPKDFPQDLLHVIQSHSNAAKQLHIPAQSGSSAVLERMRRDHDRSTYDTLINDVRRIIPRISLSSDFIVGFCGENDDDHQSTLDLVRQVGYDHAFMFAYSQRARTHAARNLVDDVPNKIKKQRLIDIIDTFHHGSKIKSQRHIGSVQLVLVSGKGRRFEQQWIGRADSYQKIVFPRTPVRSSLTSSDLVDVQLGDYVAVRVQSATQATLSAEVIARTTLTEFTRHYASSSRPQSGLSPIPLSSGAMYHIDSPNSGRHEFDSV